MKVIDVLNKIANGEEVKFRTKVDDCIYELTKGAYLYDITSKEETRWWIDEEWLNEEVEIIEDKKIEKIKIEQDTPNSNFYIRDKNGTKCYMTKHSKIIVDKVNGIIDKLNKENK